jgi:hypothetical protein
MANINDPRGVTRLSDLSASGIMGYWGIFAAKGTMLQWGNLSARGMMGFLDSPPFYIPPFFN